MDFKLGQKVKYIRLDPEEKEISGEGNIISNFIGSDGREIARVKDGDNSFNIDLVALNTTEAGARKYFDHVKKIRAHADKINEGIKATATAGNDEIEAMNLDYMGPKVEIEV